MSNRRNPNARGYRSGYLRSVPWFRRRDSWFAQAAATGELACAAFHRAGVPREFELHHITYAGVVQDGTRWIAGEAHNDLIPLHPLCHELLHRFIDTDPILARHRSREDATAQALPKVLARIEGTLR